MEITKELEGIKLNLNRWLASQRKYIKEEQEKTHSLYFKSNRISIESIRRPLEFDRREALKKTVDFIKDADLKELCVISLALALRKLDFAEFALAKGELARAINMLAATDSMMKFFYRLQNKSLTLEAARSELAKLGGLARLANDPRQTEKTFIFECWQDWQKSPDTYASKAAFSRDMMTKCEHLKSQKKIEDWCREWKKKLTLPAG